MSIINYSEFNVPHSSTKLSNRNSASDFEDATSPLKVRLKDIDITKDSDIKVEEYGIIRKKTLLESNSNQKDKPNNVKKININKKGYPYFDNSFTFKNQQVEFLKDHFILDGQIKNKSEFTKYVEDLIRINFKLSNNIRPINICSFAYTKNNKSMRVYAKCLYETDGCRKYKFCIDFCSIPYHTKVFTNKKNIFHPQCKKV